jgi:hypothetical protein
MTTTPETDENCWIDPIEGREVVDAELSRKKESQLSEAIYLLHNIYANAAESPEWIRDKILRFIHIEEWVN